MKNSKGTSQLEIEKRGFLVLFWDKNVFNSIFDRILSI
jgi:hypothetical protein